MTAAAAMEALRQWSAAHGEKARAEGWGIRADGVRQDKATPRIEMRKELDPRRFATDADAWNYVVALARRGSRPHVAALAVVDPVEAAIISRATGWQLAPAA